MYQTLSITIVDSCERRLFHKFSRKDRWVIFGTSGSLIHFKTNRYSKPWVTESKHYTLWLILHHGQRNYIKGRGNENKIVMKVTICPFHFLCPFKYYAENILRIRKPENTFPILIGNLFHHVLQNMYSDGFNIDNYFIQFLENKE